MAEPAAAAAAPAEQALLFALVTQLLKPIRDAETATMKYLKLLLCLFLDFVGVLSYLVPGIAEMCDVFWAPFAGYLVFYLFGNNLRARFPVRAALTI